MAKPTTRSTFKTYCLRELGFPVIDINVDDDQLEDRIDEALQFFQDYHFDGVEKIYMKHKITTEDIARKWIYVPDAVIGVVNVFPFDDSNSSINMFDLRYQLRLHDLYDFTSVSYVPYEITMQHIATINLLFSGKPQYRFNRHLNKLFLDIDWNNNITTNDWVVVECYRKLDPDTFVASGTANVASASVVVTGTETNFYNDLFIGDEITVGSQTQTIVQINSDTSLNVYSAFTSTATGQTISKSGISDVWNDRFLKRYATALIKKQWGNNLKKFAGIQMPGGVMLNGQAIYDEAVVEIQKIEEDIQSLNVLPPDILVG
jgi:hypothetical protein